MCHARRVNDQYHCERCGYQWDVSDQDAPTCRTEHDVAMVRLREILNIEEKGGESKIRPV